jgi:hypothetical protein
MTAAVTYTRKDFEIKAYYVNNPDYSGIEELGKQMKTCTSGKMTCAAKKENTGSPYEYILSDFVWQGEPYLLSAFSSGQPYYPAGTIKISKNSNYGSITALPLDARMDDPYLTYQKAYASFTQTTPPPAEAEKYIFGEDSYSFDNSRDSFFSASAYDPTGFAYNTSDESVLSTKFYNLLISGASNSEIAKINSDLREGFKGNCFGMSVTSALFYTGGLGLSRVDAGAKNAYALAKPVSNTALRDAIVYYQLLQNYSKYMDEWLAAQSNKDQNTNVKAFLETLEKSLPDPVVLGIVSDDWGHAMLAYDMEKTSSGYKVMLYDPNNYQQPVTLSIDVYNGMYLTSFSDANYRGARVINGNPSNDGLFAEENFRTALRPTEFALDFRKAIVTSSDNSIKIEADGKQAVFENGVKTTGTLDASYCGPVNDIGERARFTFLVDLPNNEPVSIQTANGAQISVQIAKPNAGGSGIYAETVTESASKTTIDPTSNAVEVAGNIAGQIEISVASDKTTGELFGTTVEVTGTEVSITPTANGAVVKSDKQATITVSGATEYVSFENVECGGGITVNNSGSTSVIKDSNGKTLSSGTAAAGGGKSGTTPVSFSDVPSGAWYAADVRAVAEAGIFSGKSNGVFAPNDNVTLAEAVKLAAAVHAKLTGSDYDFSGGSPWYQPYLDYLNQTGLFPNLSGYSFTAPADRELFAKVMSGVLSAMSQSERSRNTIEDGAIPDVPNAAANKEIYALYRAGIVAGSDAKGTYNPYTSITRSEVAAIIHRFIDAGQRKSVTLTAAGSIDSYVPAGFDWGGGANGDDTFIDGKWVSPDGQSVLYIAHDEGPDSFTIWYYSCKDGYQASAIYELKQADMIGDGKAESAYTGLTFTGVRGGLLVESDWLDDLYDAYGNPDGIYYLAQAR